MLIGFSGYRRSGKDTAAGFLKEQGWYHRAFADKLREFLYIQNPLLGESGGDQGFRTTTWTLQEFIDKYGWEGYKDADPYELSHITDEVRRLITRTATEAARGLLGENVWIDATFRDYPPGHLVISDVRFPNEADAIKERGGSVFRIHRPGVTANTDHISEHALDDYPYDAIIHNEGGLEDFRNQVNIFVQLTGIDN